MVKIAPIDSVLNSVFSTSIERLSTSSTVNKSTKYHQNQVLEVVFGMKSNFLFDD